MKTSKYNELKNFVEAPFSVSGIKNLSNEHKMLNQLLADGITHTGYYRGSGRHTQAVDLTVRITSILDKLNIAYETGNDAPRGGVSGNFVKITMPAFLKEVRKAKAIIKKSMEEERLEWERKAAAHDEHMNWVKSEAAKLDLEPYREEILSIINRPNPATPYSVYHDTPSRKEIGKVCWELSHSHKGFNLEVLKHALKSFKIYK